MNLVRSKERRLNRLKNYNYSQDGYYFVTLCTKNQEEYFGEIKNDEMVLNDSGKITKNCWLDISNHFLNTLLDEFIIMPNHLHGIIIVGYNDRCTLQPQSRNMELLPKIISQFKEPTIQLTMLY